MSTGLLTHLPLFSLNIQEDQINCLTRGSNRTGEHRITVRFGGAERHLRGSVYYYTPNPNITMAAPSKSFLRWWIKFEIFGSSGRWYFRREVDERVLGVFNETCWRGCISASSLGHVDWIVVMKNAEKYRQALIYHVIWDFFIMVGFPSTLLTQWIHIWIYIRQPKSKEHQQQQWT